MFLKNAFTGEIAIIVAQAPEASTLVRRAESSPRWELDVVTHNPDGESAAKFKREWLPWEPFTQPPNAPEKIPTPPLDALRKVITGVLQAPQFSYGVLEALASLFPEGAYHLFDRVDGYIHRFAELRDLQLVAKRYGGEPITFGSEQGLSTLPREHLEAVASHLDAPVPPAKPTRNYIKELFDMAKKAKAKQARKVSKVKGAAKRADGPVAKAWGIFEKVADKTDTAKMLEAATKAGINEATAKTQLYRFRKEKGIKAVRGRPNGKKVAAKSGTTKAKKSKPAAKKKATVKKSAAKGEKKRRPGVTPLASPHKPSDDARVVKPTPPVAAVVESAAASSAPPPASEAAAQPGA